MPKGTVNDLPASSNAAERQDGGVYRAILESTGQGFCTIEVAFDEHEAPVDYRFVEVSSSFERQTGIENAAGRWMREIAPDQDRFWFETYGRVARTGKPEQFENYSTPLDRWWSVYAFKIDGAARIAVLFDDITDRKRAEAALRTSEQQFESLLNQAPLGVYLVDSDFVIRQVNPVALPVFGDIPGGPVGRDFDEVIHILWDKKYADEVVGIFRHTLETGEPYVSPERAEYRADRDVIEYYEWRVDRISLAGGQYGVVCYFRDISAQVNARKEIEQQRESTRKSEAKFAALFDNMAEGFALFDVVRAADGQIIDLIYREANKALEHQTGFDRAKTVGQRLTSILTPADADRWIPIFARAVDPGEPVTVEEYAGTVGRWFSVSAYAHGENEIAVFYHDISERKHAEVVLRENEERQAFLLKLSDALRSIADPLEIQMVAMSVLGEHLEIVGAQYYESTDNGEHFSSFGGYTDGSVAKVERVRLDDFGPFTKEAYRAGRTLVVDDVWHDDRITPEQAAAYEALGVCAYVGVPLIKAGRLVVALGAVHSAPKRWTKDETALVEETAQRTWAAVERARAEAALRESEARGRDVLENMGEAFVLLDHDFRIVDLNAEAMRLEDRPREAIVGKTHWDAHPGAAPELGDLYRLAMAERREVALEHRYGWPDGRTTWLAMRAFPAGNGLAIFYRDVTDRKVASEALRESEERYRALATVGSSSIYRMSPDWREMRQLDGVGFVVDLAEPTTDWINTYIPADERPRVEEAIERAIRTKDVFELEHRVLRADGTVGWTFSRAIPLLDESGEITEWFGVASDVTARVKADQSFTRLFEASPAPFLVLAPDPPQFTITEVNDAYLTATMRTREDLVGRPLFDAFPDNPDDPTNSGERNLRASLERVLASGQPDKLPGLKYDIARPDGTFEERWWSPVNSPILDENGEVEAIIHNANDVTEELRADAMLRESKRHQGLLLAELQHRVRNILAMIQSVVRRTLATSESAEEYASHLRGRIAAMARTQAVLTRNANRRVDLEEAIREELLSVIAPEEQFWCEGPDVALPPRAAEILTLAIHELATNSVKYGAFASAEGQVEIRWAVEVRDAQQWLAFEWEESRVSHGGFHREGFGTELITRRVPYELGGRGTLTPVADGILATIEFPLQPSSSVLETGMPENVQ